MEPWSVHSLVAASSERLGHQTAISLRDYAVALQERGLPVIFTLGHLAHIVGVDHEFLRQTVNRNREVANYRIYRISKRSGGYRYIHAVGKQLLDVQSFLNEHVLQRLHTHQASMAYHRGSGGIRRCAEAHCGCRWMLQIDLKDFFWDITEPDVFRVFESAGYTRLLSFCLARLCTTIRLPREARKMLPYSRRYVDRPDFTPPHLPYGRGNLNLIGVLPQGSPTSPMLANLVARKLDESIQAVADRHGLVYTRYADDLCLSARGEMGRETVSRVRTQVFAAIHASGFMVNKQKTRISGPGSRKEVVGLLVDGVRPVLPKHTRARIDRLLYAISTYGIAAVAAHDGFDSPLGLYHHLAGLVAYVHDVDPIAAAKFQDRLKSVPHPLAVS